jgi:hypothetical protein
MLKVWLLMISFAVLDVLLIAVGFVLLYPKCGFNG